MNGDTDKLCNLYTNLLIPSVYQCEKFYEWNFIIILNLTFELFDTFLDVLF